MTSLIVRRREGVAATPRTARTLCFVLKGEGCGNVVARLSPVGAPSVPQASRGPRARGRLARGRPGWSARRAVTETAPRWWRRRASLGSRDAVDDSSVADRRRDVGLHAAGQAECRGARPLRARASAKAVKRLAFTLKAARAASATRQPASLRCPRSAARGTRTPSAHWRGPRCPARLTLAVEAARPYAASNSSSGGRLVCERSQDRARRGVGPQDQVPSSRRSDTTYSPAMPPAVPWAI